MSIHLLTVHNLLLVIAFILALMSALAVPQGPRAGWQAWSWVFFVAALLFLVT